MIYLTAQPASTYFYWQLEIQLRNFKNIGLQPKNIHVLLAVSLNDSNDKSLKIFLEQNSNLASIYIYQDKREDKSYISSIRPNILYQHFMKFPELEQETIVYIDSDILLKRRFSDRLINDDVCYVSDTRSYLDSDYIIQSGSEDLLKGMASVVGIPVQKIKEENDNTGGAQYILKNIKASFWSKVELDSTNLYQYMKSYNDGIWQISNSEGKNFSKKDEGIQAWCSDMWALLWNLWRNGQKVLIDSELDFLWPNESIEKWGEKIILHYTGETDDTFEVFSKIRYISKMPWYDSRLDKVSNKNCSSIVVDAIKERKREFDEARPIVENMVVIYKCDDFTEDMLINFKTIKKFYQKNINIPVFLYCVNNELIVDEDLQVEFSYQYIKKQIKDNSKVLLLPVGQVIDAFDLLRFKDFVLDNESYRVKFQNVYNLDAVIYANFATYLDIEVLTENLGKLSFTSSIENDVFLYDKNLFNKVVVNSLELDQSILFKNILINKSYVV